VPFRGTPGDSDSNDDKICNDFLEEFGEQERSESFIHNHVRGRSFFSPLCTDTEGIIEDHHLLPPVWTQDTFTGSPGAGAVYHPAMECLPDHSVGNIPNTYVFDALDDIGGAGSQSTQFSKPEIIPNLSQNIMIDSSVGLSSTSIGQPAVEKSENLVETQDMPSGEMLCSTTATLDSSAAWKGTIILDQNPTKAKRRPLSPEDRKRVNAVRQSACRNCRMRRLMCSPRPPCNSCLRSRLKIPLNANNNLLRSHLSNSMIELEQRSTRVYCYPVTVFHTDELRSDSGQRVTATNTTFGSGSTSGLSQNLQKYRCKVPFTTQEVQAPSSNLALHKHNSYTNGFSEDVTVCGDLHDQDYNLMRHFEAGEEYMANVKSISRRLLV
jgi:hypothetical protein